jgi:hypothetical protein
MYFKIALKQNIVCKMKLLVRKYESIKKHMSSKLKMTPSREENLLEYLSNLFDILHLIARQSISNQIFLKEKKEHWMTPHDDNQGYCQSATNFAIPSLEDDSNDSNTDDEIFENQISKYHKRHISEFSRCSCNLR